MIVESVDVEEEKDAVGREAKAASIEPLAAATREPLSRTRLTLLTLLTPPVLVIVKPSSVNTALVVLVAITIAQTPRMDRFGPILGHTQAISCLRLPECNTFLFLHK